MPQPLAQEAAGAVEAGFDGFCRRKGQLICPQRRKAAGAGLPRRVTEGVPKAAFLPCVTQLM